MPKRITIHLTPAQASYLWWEQQGVRDATEDRVVRMHAGNILRKLEAADVVPDPTMPDKMLKRAGF